jgi:threonyl-tRNA synthetase
MFTRSRRSATSRQADELPGPRAGFNSGLRSYRDLPLRYGEFGACHRNEPPARCTGSCACAASRRTTATSSAPRPDRPECVASTKLAAEGLRDFGFTDIAYKSRCGPRSASASDELGQGRGGAAGALRACGAQWDELPGEGAFYGPKIEYHAEGCDRPRWQCGTMQVDFMMPGAWARSSSTRTTRASSPVMLHRAIVGSMERFIGILIENHAGALPLGSRPSRWS